jgi:hypothetical protein
MDLHPYDIVHHDITRHNRGKMFHISNKNLLYMNGYTYVVMLIVDKKWKKPLYKFCGLRMRPFVKFLNNVMYEWMHTCNDLDNEHVIAFGTRT